MDLSDLLAPGAVIPDLRARTKAALLKMLAARAAEATGQPPGLLLDRLLAREALGSTGFGGGVAIPHGKLPGLPAVTGLFARLAAPVDYAAIDNMPVDLVFMLLAPEGAGADHLKALARVSRAFRDPLLAAKLRAAASADAIYAMLAGGEDRPRQAA